MKINYLNKWGGFFWGPSPIAQTMRYRIFRDLIVFTSAIVICCIAPWESAGIKEDYYLFLKKMAFVLLVLSVIPILTDMIIDIKKNILNIASLSIAISITGLAFFVLFFNF
ncbi:hypothetical protein [Culturomica massiliensis]|uniref:hypothetical protein n=1 Tax=Culturomica massiliensis TaxID=1841857 RepID=UPI00034088BD|nr:hypothetical protein [Culturomica massiliensis]CCZ07220.1 unknown [Odoribacter sp. CAG:788]